MPRKPDFCASCGRQRGDGRRDRKWRYRYCDIAPTLTVLVCFCRECCVLLDKEQALRESLRAAPTPKETP